MVCCNINPYIHVIFRAEFWHWTGRNTCVTGTQVGAGHVWVQVGCGRSVPGSGWRHRVYKPHCCWWTDSDLLLSRPVEEHSISNSKSLFARVHVNMLAVSWISREEKKNTHCRHSYSCLTFWMTFFLKVFKRLKLNLNVRNDRLVSEVRFHTR